VKCEVKFLFENFVDVEVWGFVERARCFCSLNKVLAIDSCSGEGRTEQLVVSQYFSYDSSRDTMIKMFVNRESVL